MIIKTSEKVRTLEKLLDELPKKNDYEYKIKKDRWSEDFIAKNKCIVVKKNATCGAKIRFIESNMVKVEAIRPSVWITDRGIIGFIISLFVKKTQEEIVLNTVNNIKNMH